jgi:hypothetical protein
MWRASLILLLLAPHLHAACQCVIRFGVCDEVHQSDAVFVGTVESVAPLFLDPFARSKAMASIPAAEIARLQTDASPEAVEKLRTTYLGMFTGIPDTVRAQIAQARTARELQNAFESVQSEGRVARFRIRNLYKRQDDDDAGSKARTAAPGFIDVWTGTGECGVDFQVGETYLVYALEDEASGKLETSACMRTRRVSDEKGDLAYLYFMENLEKESGRLEGFVSTSFADQNLPRYEDSVAAPASGSVLELAGGAGPRYTESGSDGRFTFDGLKEDDYRLSLLEPGFPKAPRAVILSRTIHVAPGACTRPILVVPSRK